MTDCPKCGAAAAVEAIECPKCGVVFAKLERRAAVAAGAMAPEIDVPRDPVTRRDVTSGPVRFARAALLVGLVIWTWSIATAGPNQEQQTSVLHYPNLVFHEAGHVIFSPFGRFMTALGGSLLQFLVPVSLAIAFLRKHNQFGAVVCAWWAAQNLVDVSPYIADARALQLVLIGGRTGAEVEGHDWEYILTQLGWLHRDVALGVATRRVGLAMMATAIVWGAVYLARNRPEPAVVFERLD
jgi:hypothetical protein